MRFIPLSNEKFLDFQSYFILKVSYKHNPFALQAVGIVWCWRFHLFYGFIGRTVVVGGVIGRNFPQQ
jgi:hypothetical protein